MVLVVEKNKELEGIWWMDALQKLLKEIHSLFLMFHGSIRLLLEKEPTGEVSRSHLYPFIRDYLSGFLVGKKLQLPSLVNCLKENATVHMLTIGQDAAIEVQALVRTLDSCSGNALCHSLILFQDLLVSTTLSSASMQITKVEEKLSNGWGGENAYHVGGYRYLLVDDDRQILRASPPGKVATLAKESLLTMSKLREKVDQEKSRAKQDGVVEVKELEVTIRAKNNAWVICRIIRGKELYMVLEKANDTVLYASDMVGKFSDR